MKRFIAALLLLPSLAMGAANDVFINQRDGNNVNTLTRTVVHPTTDAVFGYNAAANLPVYWTLGNNLVMNNGVLNAPLIKGDKGDKGDTGATGTASTVPGPTGPAGPASTVPGPAGPTGPASTVPGPKGDTGATGATGATGPAGAASTVPGPAGPQGIQGIPGVNGTNGTNGVDGAVGPAGPAGAAAPLPTSAPATRTLNTAFQISATRPVLVSYSVDISVTSVLLAGTQGTATLQYADNSAMTTNLVTIDGGTSSTGGVLNVTNIGTVKLGGMIPAGKYVRIVTANTSGTPTFTYRIGSETTF